MQISKNTYNQVAVVILAAGESNRMNTPKPFLRFDAKRVFIDKIIDEYRQFGCSRIVVTINKKHTEWISYIAAKSSSDSIIFIENNHPEYERFYSVKLGLQNIDDVDFSFIHNIDNPFIDQEILNNIYEFKSDGGYVVPNYLDKGGHPILLHREAINKIISETNNSVNLKNILSSLKRINCDSGSDKVLININTQDDYEKYFQGN
ncbi:NTP transferase domain-containing protein [Bacteroidota bacterium]